MALSEELNDAIDNLFTAIAKNVTEMSNEELIDLIRTCPKDKEALMDVKRGQLSEELCMSLLLLDNFIERRDMDAERELRRRLEDNRTPPE